MPKELPPRYDHAVSEEKIYALWEKSGFFNPDNLPKAGSWRQGAESHNAKPGGFCIIMPPPNANGALHIGHALFVTLQDIMTRFNRMQGKRVLWLPGMDHAGFETQVVFEKKLEKEGRNRFEMEREALYKEMLAFTLENKKIVENQLRKLGASCDWSRNKFTLDPDIVEEVQKTFIRMHEDGLIYRAERLVNWCVKHQTALSDLEVKHIEQKDPLYYMKYGSFTLATVRPETKFGDTAVAVNPKDTRYKKWVGKEIEVEGLIGEFKIKVIADNAVDPKFGTGVVKVTPAHDFNDFEIGLRHNLERKQVIDRYGKLNERTGPYAGLKIDEARKRVTEDLQKRGLLEKIDENYTHAVAVCYKCGKQLEPLLLPQWWVKMKPLAAPAIKAIESGKIQFYPARFQKITLQWLKNIRDWNISRQIIWGIRIPAWYKTNLKPRTQNSKFWNLKIYGRDIFEAIARGTKKIETRAGRPRGEGKYWGDFKPGDEIEFSLADEKNDAIILSVPPIRKYVNKVVHFKTMEEMLTIYKPEDDYPGKTAAGIKKWWKQRPALYQRIEKYGIWAIELRDTEEEMYVGMKPPRGEGWTHDSDVFDTWFSSGQWPYLTLGFKDGKPLSEDMKNFYPTDVMETAGDIIFFWVARMIMLGIYRTGKIPFKNVYLHGLVRDKDKQKMSKSKGNVIDPLGVAAEYGTDAVRMALIAGNTPGKDTAISEDKIRGYRNFITKIWNIARFILMQTEINTEKKSAGERKRKNPPLLPKDKKHLARLAALKKQITKDIEAFRFHRAAEKIYHYIWHEFADKIIEEAKLRLQNGSEKEKKGVLVMLTAILKECLIMLHPFAPFVTEEIYQKLSPVPKELLTTEKWQ